MNNKNTESSYFSHIGSIRAMSKTPPAPPTTAFFLCTYALSKPEQIRESAVALAGPISSISLLVSVKPEHESLLNQIQTRKRPAMWDSLCLDRIEFRQGQGIRNLSLIKVPWVLRIDHPHQNPRPVPLIIAPFEQTMPSYPDCYNPKTKHHKQRISHFLIVSLPRGALPTPIDLVR